MSASTRIASKTLRFKKVIEVSVPAPESCHISNCTYTLPPQFLLPNVNTRRMYSSMPAYVENEFKVNYQSRMPTPIPSQNTLNRNCRDSTTDNRPRNKVTVSTLAKMKKEGRRITVLTAHDYPSSLLCELGDIDVCLIGDSLAMVALGHEDTTHLSLEEMLHHCRAVSRGAKSPLRIGDMVFGSCVTTDDALHNAVRMVREGRVEGVKIEGGVEMANIISKLVKSGIPVMGHVGLQPQKVAALGGYRIQGKTSETANRIIKDSIALQEAGCFSIVIEAVPSPVAKAITDALIIPTIGIGAGPHTSGQVLVQLDMLGMGGKNSTVDQPFSSTPKFCKLYEQFGILGINAVRQYATEVRESIFPEDGKHTYSMKDDEHAKFISMVSQEAQESAVV